MKITKKEKEALLGLGIVNPEDIVTHYPFRYEVREQLPFNQWQKGDKVTFEGELVSIIRSTRFGKRSISRFELRLANNEIVTVSIYNRPWLSAIKSGNRIAIFGKYDGNHKVTASQYNTKPLSEQLGIIPIYHCKDGITVKKITELIKYYLDQIEITEIIPSSLRKKYKLLSRNAALKLIHFPQNNQQTQQAIRTLKYEQYLLFQIAVLTRKQQLATEQKGHAKTFSFDDVYTLFNQLSFSLASGQLRSINEILEELQSTSQMYRLLQGDVGSGKTLVAAAAIYASTISQKQAAFMVPTEILAKQQAKYFSDLFRPVNLNVKYLISAMNASDKKETLEQLKNGQIDLIVGTHALIQDSVEFNDLGLVITDEQHRFGVTQRNKLKEKGNQVDYLLMSATPIPRTLANIIYGDMDISTIDTLPTERKPIITTFLRQNTLATIIDDLLESIEEGNRCYIVCPAIEDTKNTTIRNVTDIYDALCVEINQKRMKSFKIGLLHGKLTSEDKENVMQEFKSGQIQILITTTVIEVGINVKEANTMIIYDAHRFGLSQLHQLRGRVGRGSKQGRCYLLSDSQDDLAIKRLDFLSKTTNGFEIAEYDLATRGPGDVLGVRQSGLPSFALGDIISDFNIVTTARNDAYQIISNNQDQENQLIIEKALKLYQQ